jgi:hypothetical protein
MEPNSRAEFLQYCLGKLGAGGTVNDPFHGVIDIEMSAYQADNCIDDALTMWRQYHYEATQRTYFKQLVDQTTLNNMYVVVPDNIMSVVRVLEISTDNLSIFDVRYQLRLQDFYNFSNVSINLCGFGEKSPSKTPLIAGNSFGTISSQAKKFLEGPTTMVKASRIQVNSKWGASEELALAA